MSWDDLRRTMVEEQLIRRGIRDARVLEAMRAVPRHFFVPEDMRAFAYEDRALPIGYDQTISQPYMVAWMLQSLNFLGTEKVLEIGTGFGYNASLLGRLAKEVYSLEIVPALAEDARRRLQQFSAANVHVEIADGSTGFLPHAPYDVILLAAAAPEVPPLISQLTGEGKLLIPLAHADGKDMLTLFQRRGTDVRRQELGACLFVPLRGQFGWGTSERTPKT